MLEEGASAEDLAWLGAADVASRCARGELSPVEVTDAALARIERLNPVLNAFLHVSARAARQRARQLERHRSRGGRVGRLFGVPVSLKDLILTRDAPTTAGSRIHGDGLSGGADALIASRLRRAGAVLLGKTNLHEVALGITSENEHYGPVRNPWNRDRVAGGSSGGSAAAVAAGLGAASIGSDTRGSIRIPAACCGITGLKPTTGLLSTDGVLPLSPTLDCVGPMTRSVEDAALLLGVLAGGSGSARRYAEALDRPVEGLQVGVAEHLMRDLAPEVAAAVEAALKQLERVGMRRREVALPEVDDALEQSYVIGGAEAVEWHDTDLRERPEAYGPKLRQRLKGGYALTAVDYVRAQRKRAEVRRAFQRCLQQVDLLAGASLPAEAAPLGSDTLPVGDREEPIIDGSMRLTAPQSLAGVPALSLPCALGASGLPVSLQLVAARYREDLLFTAGAELQRLTDWHRRRPELPAA